MIMLSAPVLFLIAAVLAVFTPERFRGPLTLVTPMVALLSILVSGAGNHGALNILNFDLVFYRIDSLSQPFGIVFCLAAFLAALYAWHVRDRVQQIATLAYAGAALGGVFAGDLIALFLWWEATAVSSVFLILARGTAGAMATALRYLIIQVLSGMLLFAGLLMHFHDTGSIGFDHLGLVSTGTTFIFVAFGIKCAFPLLHNWLHDAYPAATVTGTVVLSIFTTKMAVYALARGYAGTEVLVYIGAVMALFPILFALIENDLRRVLAFSLNSQLGFMVVGVGIGTELALNGTVAHAFASVLYKSLLFMSVGAVLYRTGTSKASELGGLYRTMPLTALCCLVGACSVAAFPLFSGFVSKSLIIDAASKNGFYGVWFALVVASAAVMAHTAIKIPFFAFFGKDSGKRPEEAPVHMRWAMIATASLCVMIGVVPGVFHALLPFEVDYQAYTFAHVITQMQLLCFAALGFVYLLKTGLYPMDRRGVNINSDWVYRKGILSVLPSVVVSIVAINATARRWALNRLERLGVKVFRYASPSGPLADAWGVKAMIGAVVVLMLAILLFNLVPT